MEFGTNRINKGIFIVICSLAWTNGLSQTPTHQLIDPKINDKAHSINHPVNISGDWKSVKHDYRGVEKFSLKQAEEIRKSILHIEKQTYYFRNLSFVGKCRFYEWRVKPFDAYDVNQVLELTYTKKELKKVFLLDPVDKNGNTACYNECTVFKMRDTLITNCGGYIFYWVKL